MLLLAMLYIYIHTTAQLIIVFIQQCADTPFMFIKYTPAHLY